MAQSDGAVLDHLRGAATGCSRVCTVSRSGRAAWESTMRLSVSSLIAVSTCAGYSTTVRTFVPRVRHRFARLREHPFQLRLVVLQRLLGILLGQVAALDQRRGVELSHRTLLVDQLVHVRVGQRRVVGLVVPAAPVADQVDDHVLVERLAEVEGHPRHPHTRLRVVTVDMEDRGLHRACVPRRWRTPNCDCSPEVVKPTWLFTMMCSVPPVR